MATTHTILPTKTLRSRGGRMPHRSRTTPVLRHHPGPRSISELDEAHRRMKRNMQALASLLRFQAEDVEAPAAEALLTELETRLQAMAGDLRSRCRAGNFDQIELAVYLRHAARLWNTPPGCPPKGGWSFDTTQSLVFRPDPDSEGPRASRAAATTDLEQALESTPARWREVIRRAVYSCAVTFPPWFFDWRSTGGAESPGPRPSSEFRLRVRIAPVGVKVAVSLSGVGPGLPPHFGVSHQRTLARDLASSLGRLVQDDRSQDPDCNVEFEVAFAGSGDGLECSAAA